MRRGLALLALVLCSVPAVAQQREVPYWASLRAAEVNMRVGPSEDFPIEWVYHRKGLPVKVVRVMQGWRLVEDPDGARGWILVGLLTAERGAIVVGKDLAELRESADADSRVLWRAEPGVVGELGDCESGFCELAVGARKGWVRADRLWGAGEP
jgi:SH3-like domain-containing protein